MDSRKYHIPESVMLRDRISIEYLRNMTDYIIAHQSQGILYIGRDAETKYYKKNFPGQILHPERRGEEWTILKNMAFMAGAMEAGKKFLIVTSLNNIAQRARRALSGKVYLKHNLGFATAEILWLDDNGYTFRPHESDGKKSWAIPPDKKIESCVIKKYGHTHQDDTEYQVMRIEKIANDCKPVVRSKQNEHRKFNTALVKRTARFGNPIPDISPEKKSDVSSLEMSAKIAARGQRFGNSIPDSSPEKRSDVKSVEMSAKIAARSQRFGNSIPDNRPIVGGREKSQSIARKTRLNATGRGFFYHRRDNHAKTKFSKDNASLSEIRPRHDK